MSHELFEYLRLGQHHIDVLVSSEVAGTDSIESIWDRDALKTQAMRSLLAYAEHVLVVGRWACFSESTVNEADTVRQRSAKMSNGGRPIFHLIHQEELAMKMDQG